MEKSVNERTSDGKRVYRAPRDGGRAGLRRRAAHTRSPRAHTVPGAQGDTSAENVTFTRTAAGAQGDTSAENVTLARTAAGAQGDTSAENVTLARTAAGAQDDTSAENVTLARTAAGAQGDTSTVRAQKNAVALLGAVVLLLIAAGITAAVIFGIRAASGSAQTKAQAERARLEQLISPLAMCGAEPFDDVSALDSETLARICVWSSLVTRTDEPDTDDSGRILLPGAAVGATCESLFGSAAHFTPVSFYDGGVYFEYDVVRDTYHIPVTGIEGGYTPRITDIRKEKGGKVLTVDYYEEDYSGAAHKAKTMIYVLSGADGSERIASVSAAG